MSKKMGKEEYASKPVLKLLWAWKIWTNPLLLYDKLLYTDFTWGNDVDHDTLVRRVCAFLAQQLLLHLKVVAICALINLSPPLQSQRKV